MTHGTLDGCRVLIYGAGGHGRSVLDAALAAPAVRVEGFLDDCEALHGTAVDGVPVLGGEAWLAERGGDALRIALAVGDNRARERLAERLRRLGVATATIVHPTAYVSPRASVEPGCVILAGAVVGPGVSLGEGSVVNTAATVDHDATIGRFVHVAPGSHLAGAVRLGDRVRVGLGASIAQGIAIGEDAVLGAGAVVLAALPAGVVAVGVPAEIVGGSCE